MNSMKEVAIRNYISGIDFKGEDWKISQIKEDMKKFLGEEPGIDIAYVKDIMINEFSGTAHEIKKIESISIVFTDLDNRFKKLNFLI